MATSSAVSSADRLLSLVPPMALPTRFETRQAAGVDLPVVAINLPWREDRWKTLQTRMAGAGIDHIIRAPAVVGAELSEGLIADLTARPAAAVTGAPTSHLALTRPAIGCFLSHLAIWRWVIAKSIPRVLVLEDDAAPAPDYDAARFVRFVRGLQDEDGLVMVGRILMAGLGEKPVSPDRPVRLYYYNGTFAYTITPGACRMLLTKLHPLAMHIDHQISRTLIANRQSLAAYSAEPPFFEPDWSLNSDIYVPLEGEAEADRVLGGEFEDFRRLLISEGRPLRDP